MEAAMHSEEGILNHHAVNHPHFTALLRVFSHIHYKEQYMFNLKSTLSLIFAAICAIAFLHSSVSYAEENPSPVVASAMQININTADAETIASNLKGIGLKKAQAIIEYRESYGPFHDVEELLEVKGIGKSTLEKNAGLVTVE